MTEPKCEMRADCTAEVAMLDNKGYIYCEAHGLSRRGWIPCRKLRPHELNRLRNGQQVERY